MICFIDRHLLHINYQALKISPLKALNGFAKFTKKHNLDTNWSNGKITLTFRNSVAELVQTKLSIDCSNTEGYYKLYKYCNSTAD